MTLLYIDTNIFISAVRDEVNEFKKDISTPARKMFLDAASCKYHIVVSTWAMKELNKKIKEGETEMLFHLIKKKIVPIIHSEYDFKEARQRSSSHFEDALHIILAERSKSDIIITRNDNDFIKIGTHLPVQKPEWL